MTFRPTALLLTTLLLSSPVAAFAQTAAAAPAAVPPVAVGQRVWVANTEGAEIQGNVLSITDTAIEILTPAGPRRVLMSDVSVISKKDSNRNGFWIGAAVGAVSGAVTAGSVGTVAPGGMKAALVVTGILGYAGLGVLIDNVVVGRVVLYHRPERVSAAAVNVAPIISLGIEKRVGLGGTITWR